MPTDDDIEPRPKRKRTRKRKPNVHPEQPVSVPDDGMREISGDSGVIHLK
jgi:hypothetical protein